MPWLHGVRHCQGMLKSLSQKHAGDCCRNALAQTNNPC